MILLYPASMILSKRSLMKFDSLGQGFPEVRTQLARPTLLWRADRRGRPDLFVQLQAGRRILQERRWKPSSALGCWLTRARGHRGQ